MRPINHRWVVAATLVVVLASSTIAVAGPRGGAPGGGGFRGGGFSGGLERPSAPNRSLEMNRPYSAHSDLYEHRQSLPGRTPEYGREYRPPLQPYPGDSGNAHPSREDLNQFLRLPGPMPPRDPTRLAPQPSWAHMPPHETYNMHERLQRAMTTGRPGEPARNWAETHPARTDYWKHRADTVRGHWPPHPLPPDWFHPGGWVYHHGPCPGWHYPYWAHHPWAYWWGWSPWRHVTVWFAPWGWATPVYYDYGPGGNVVYQDNRIYVQDQEVGTAEEYAQSAAALAQAAPPADPNQPQNADWLPLGTFSLSKNDQPQLSQILQLAVNKEGVVSGTLYDAQAKTSLPVQGSVDKTTQRVAITLGEGTDRVLETGIYNLTQNETPVLIHSGTNKADSYLLIRLQAPQEASPEQQQ